MVSGSYDVNNETDSSAASLVASHSVADDEILRNVSVVSVVRCEELHCRYEGSFSCLINKYRPRDVMSHCDDSNCALSVLLVSATSFN